MSKYKVSPEGVECLHGAANNLYQGLQIIEQDTETLSGIVSSNSGGLGPHEDKILEVIEQLRNTVKVANDPVIEICGALDDLADEYEEIISNPPF